jgi:uncharacterized membrane protein
MKASWDRSLWMVIGLFLMALWRTMASGTTPWILAVVGAVLLLTGLMGWCPAYGS